MNTDDLYRLLRAEHDQLQGIVDTAADPMLVLDQGLCVVEASGAFFRKFCVDRAETIGRQLYDLGNGQWDNPKLRLLLEEVIPSSSAVLDFEIERDFPLIGRRHMLVSATTLRGQGARARTMLVTISDATERRKDEAAQALLFGELQHRIRNLLAVVQSMALRANTDGRTALEFRDDFLARFRNLVWFTEFALGGEKAGDLKSLTDIVLGPYIRPDAIRVSSPDDFRPGPDVVTSLGLLLHELATNAAKYGAASTPNGRIEVKWDHDASERVLRLHWAERDGPPATPPEKTGYGSRLIQSLVDYRFHGELKQTYSDEGLTVDVAIPLDDAATTVKDGMG